jgi:uncharacterized protein YndB with AHSA1/START domain
MPTQTDPWLRVTVEVPGVTPSDVIGAFLDPAAVRRWWGGAELTVEPEIGGRYVAYFDQLGQTMRGVVTDLDQATGRFGFSWSWDHAPELPARRVDVNVDAGAVLRLSQGDYDQTSRIDRDEARTHREGWEFFLPRLAEVVTAQQR